jgi:GAF domain-containing protein
MGETLEDDTMTHDDVEALAQEIATTEGISISRALELAREQLASLRAYARSWDEWIDDALRCPVCGSRPA